VRKKPLPRSAADRHRDPNYGFLALLSAWCFLFDLLPTAFAGSSSVVAAVHFPIVALPAFWRSRQPARLSRGFDCDRLSRHLIDDAAAYMMVGA